MSRNYILNRRGGGINDLSKISLADGDVNLDQAEAVGIYKVNCTHQVGIATATEVGLTQDRFPVRVILSTNPLAGQDGASETVANYWRVTNASNAAIPFARKPLPTARPLNALYSHVKDLDEKLWDAYDRIRGAAYAVDHDPVVDEANSRLYANLMLENPTAEQNAESGVLIANIISLCVAGARVPYFLIGENAYLRAEPHGAAYAQVGNMSPSQVAAFEAAICLKLNFTRMKARYENLSDGAVSLAAYSVASCFRHGWFEHYEHKEYHTIVVSPVQNNPRNFNIIAIRSPIGCAQPAGLAVNQTIDLTGVKLNSKAVELGNLFNVTSGLMHYLFNHTTGGTVMTGTLLSILVMYNIFTKDMVAEEQVAMTSLFYEALHPTNKRAFANLFFNRSGVSTHGRAGNAPKYEKFALDSFTQIRKNPYPAGSHKAFICLQALDRVIDSGLAAFLPWAAEITDCVNVCRNVLMSGARAHIGSTYYTGELPMVQPASIDKYLPDLAMYVHTFNRGDSLSMSPHVSDEVSKRSNMNWMNLMKDLKAKDVSATSTEVVRKFLATAGSVHFAFNPEDEGTWADTVKIGRDASVMIKNIFV